MLNKILIVKNEYAIFLLPLITKKKATK